MKCLSVDIGQYYCIWQLFCSLAFFNIQFFQCNYYFISRMCFCSSIPALSCPFVVHFTGAQWVVEYSLFVLTVFCDSWIWKLFFRSAHSEMLSQKIWCTCGPQEILYFSWSLPYSWHCISIIFLLFLLASYIAHLLLHGAYFSLSNNTSHTHLTWQIINANDTFWLWLVLISIMSSNLLCFPKVFYWTFDTWFAFLKCEYSMYLGKRKWPSSCMVELCVYLRLW